MPLFHVNLKRRAEGFISVNTETSTQLADAQMYQRIPAKIVKMIIITWQRGCEQTKYRILQFFIQIRNVASKVIHALAVTKTQATLVHK